VVLQVHQVVQALRELQVLQAHLALQVHQVVVEAQELQVAQASLLLL
jgi:hypothetical protein